MNVKLSPIANPRKLYQWRAENSLFRSIHGTENPLMQYGPRSVITLHRSLSECARAVGPQGHGVIISTNQQTMNFSIKKCADISLPTLLPSSKPATDR